MNNTLLPVINSDRLMTSIARLQNHEDFRDLRKWLTTEGKANLVGIMVDKPGNNAVECGAYQLIEALENLFENSFTWASKMKGKSGQKPSMIQENIV